MLKEFIRGYAKFVGFSDDLQNDVVASCDETGEFTLTLSDCLCTLRTANVDGFDYLVSTLIVPIDDNQYAEQKEEVQALLRDDSYLFEALVLNNEQQQIAIVSSIALNNLDTESFINYMQALNLKAQLCSGKKIRVDPNFFVKCKLDDLSPAKYLAESGLDIDALKQALFTFEVQGEIVMLNLNNVRKSIILSSYITTVHQARTIEQFLELNLAFNGMFRFVCDHNHIYLEQTLDVINEPKVLDTISSFISKVLLIKSSCIGQEDEQAPISDPRTDNLAQNLSNFLMV